MEKDLFMSSFTNSWIPLFPKLGSPQQGKLHRSSGERGLKRGRSYGTRGKGGQAAVHHVRGLVQATPGAEELCPWGPTCAHASNHCTRAQGSGRSHLFRKALKWSFKKARGGIIQHPAAILGKRHGSGLLLTYISMLGGCRKDSEWSGLEGMRPRLCCHGILKRCVHAADEGTS